METSGEVIFRSSFHNSAIYKSYIYIDIIYTLHIDILYTLHIDIIDGTWYSPISYVPHVHSPSACWSIRPNSGRNLPHCGLRCPADWRCSKCWKRRRSCRSSKHQASHSISGEGFVSHHLQISDGDEISPIVGCSIGTFTNPCIFCWGNQQELGKHGVFVCRKKIWFLQFVLFFRNWEMWSSRNEIWSCEMWTSAPQQYLGTNNGNDDRCQTQCPKEYLFVPSP